MAVYRCVLSGIRASKLKDADEIRKNNFINVIDKVCKDINGWSKVLIPSNAKLLAINNKIDDIVDGKDNSKDRMQQMMVIIDALNAMGVSKGKDGTVRSALRNFSFEQSEDKFEIHRVAETEKIYIDNDPDDKESTKTKPKPKPKPKRKSKKSGGFNGGGDEGEGKYTSTFTFKVMQRNPDNPDVSKEREIEVYFVEDSLFSEIKEFSSILSGGCGCSDTISGGQFSDLKQIYDIIRVMANAETISSKDRFKSDLVTTCMEFCNGFYATIHQQNEDIYKELLYLKCGCPIRSLLNIICFLYNPETLKSQEIRSLLMEWNFSPCPIRIDAIWKKQVPICTVDTDSVTDGNLLSKYKKKMEDTHYGNFVKNFFLTQDSIPEENSDFKKLMQFEIGNARAYDYLTKMAFNNCKWINYVEYQYMTIMASKLFEIKEFTMVNQIAMNNSLPYKCECEESVISTTERNQHIEKYLEKMNI